jgi:hypothetical protein
MATTIAPPTLDEQVAELERQGFAISSRSDDEVVAMRRKWYWECFPPRVTSIVFLKVTGPLSATHIAGETDQLLARARELDTGGLGLFRVRGVLQAYVADIVEPDAQRLCSTAQPIGFNSLAFTAALDRSTGEAFFVRKTPLIGGGGMYVPKLRFLAARLFEPGTAPAREPLSGMGLVLIAIWVFAALMIVVEIVAGS